MADRTFVFDGSPAWSAEHACQVMTGNGGVAMAADTLANLKAAGAPVPRQWLADRLTLLWTMFMASRATADSDALTVWLGEHLRLLGDLPHDIVAEAIDRAVMQAKHGFIPAIGEIRTIADPIAAERRQHTARLADAMRLLKANETVI